MCLSQPDQQRLIFTGKQLENVSTDQGDVYLPRLTSSALSSLANGSGTPARPTTPHLRQQHFEDVSTGVYIFPRLTSSAIFSLKQLENI
jgi:hypothetical protein